MFERSPILLAEDCDEDILFFRKVLERAKISNPLRVVPDGEHVIAYLQGTGAYADRAEFPLPNLLALDLKIPILDGFQVLTWIKGKPALAWIWLLVLTGEGSVVEVARAYELGADSVWVKSTDLDGLGELIRLNA